MKLQLQRRYRCPDYTIGSLYVNGAYFCDTLEDKVRDIPILLTSVNEEEVEGGGKQGKCGCRTRKPKLGTFKP